MYNPLSPIVNTPIWGKEHRVFLKGLNGFEKAYEIISKMYRDRFSVVLKGTHEMWPRIVQQCLKNIPERPDTF